MFFFFNIKVRSAPCLIHILVAKIGKQLRISIFPDENLQTPLPLYLYIVKIENFHPVLTQSLRGVLKHLPNL